MTVDRRSLRYAAHARDEQIRKIKSSKNSVRAQRLPSGLSKAGGEKQEYAHDPSVFESLSFLFTFLFFVTHHEMFSKML